MLASKAMKQLTEKQKSHSNLTCQILNFLTIISNHLSTGRLYPNGKCLGMKQYMSHVMRKNLFMLYANYKGADQPAHPRSLISAFVVRCIDSIIPLVFISKISSLYLVSMAAQASLCLTWSQTPKTGFFMMRLIIIISYMRSNLR